MTDIKKRPSWDKYFMKIATLVAERSTCRRHHVGAVIVKEKRILTTGYNGAAAGLKEKAGHEVYPAEEKWNT